MPTIELTGLPGVALHITHAVVVVTTPEEGVSAILNERARAATLACDRAGMTLWLDDEGNYRGDVSVYKRVVASIRVKSVSKLKKWAISAWRDYCGEG